MNNHALLVICSDDVMVTEQYSGLRMSYFDPLQDLNGVWCDTEKSRHGEEELARLVSLVTRKPKSLIYHIQRIYYCFQRNLDEALFAAIVDFLVVLNQRGHAISWRMVLGSKSRLGEAQFNILKAHLKGDKNRLMGNKYTVLSKGLVGSDNMVQQVEKEEQLNDPLIIALDHIEYCQLDEAKAVLEEAILAHPDRQDLRQELCQLYKATADLNSFHQMLAKLTRLGISITDDWNQLNNYFKGQNNDG